MTLSRLARNNRGLSQSIRAICLLVEEEDGQTRCLPRGSRGDDAMSGQVVATERGYRVMFAYNPKAVEAIKGIPGRRFDPGTKAWTVPRGVEDALGTFATRFGLAVPPELLAAAVTADATRAASHAVDATLDVPAPEGRAYLPFQRAGIAFASSRPARLIADEMGLGKN